MTRSTWRSKRLNGIGKQTDETIPFALVGSERGIFVSRGIFEQRVSASRAPIDAGAAAVRSPCPGPVAALARAIARARSLAG